MAFDADAAAAKVAAEHEPYLFTWQHETYTVPSARTVPSGQLRRLIASDDESDRHRAFDAIEGLWPADAFAAAMEMPIDVTVQLMRGWVTGSGETGKSASPSSSTTTGGKRSKRT